MAPSVGVEKIMSKFASKIISTAFAEAPAVAKYDYILTTQNAFDNAVAKLKEATSGSAGYDELVKTVRETFDNAKKARIDFFTIMSKDASEQQKVLYDLNIKTLNNMSLDDVVAHNGVHPSEYYGENASVFGYVIDGDVTVSF